MPSYFVEGLDSLDTARPCLLAMYLLSCILACGLLVACILTSQSQMKYGGCIRAFGDGCDIYVHYITCAKLSKLGLSVDYPWIDSCSCLMTAMYLASCYVTVRSMMHSNIQR